MTSVRVNLIAHTLTTVSLSISCSKMLGVFPEKSFSSSRGSESESALTESLASVVAVLNFSPLTSTSQPWRMLRNSDSSNLITVLLADLTATTTTTNTTKSIAAECDSRRLREDVVPDAKYCNRVISGERKGISAGCSSCFQPHCFAATSSRLEQSPLSSILSKSSANTTVATTSEYSLLNRLLHLSTTYPASSPHYCISQDTAHNSWLDPDSDPSPYPPHLSTLTTPAPCVI